MIDGVKSAATTLKAAQTAGKELGAVVSSQQADMENTIQREHQARVTARLAEQQRKSILEVRAVEKFEAKIKHEQEIAKLKADTIRKYGKDAWIKVEAEKAQMEKERQAEMSAMDHDRQRQIDVLCWCFTAGALITYFFKLYKL
jgi:D-serine deaminase-like pyridoxal phosphate-dependent protein